MGIYLPNMEMPTRCDDCVMGHELAVGTNVAGYGCLAMLRMGDARIRPISCGTRPDWCPVIEVPTPHGRLIDADALYEQFLHEQVQLYKLGRIDFENQKREDMHEIFTAPTIIGAEET